MGLGDFIRVKVGDDADAVVAGKDNDQTVDNRSLNAYFGPGSVRSEGLEGISNRELIQRIYTLEARAAVDRERILLDRQKFWWGIMGLGALIILVGFLLWLLISIKFYDIDQHFQRIEGRM